MNRGAPITLPSASRPRRSWLPTRNTNRRRGTGSPSWSGCSPKGAEQLALEAYVRAAPGSGLTGPAVSIGTNRETAPLRRQAIVIKSATGVGGLRFGTGCRFGGPYLLTPRANDRDLESKQNRPDLVDAEDGPPCPSRGACVSSQSNARSPTTLSIGRRHSSRVYDWGSGGASPAAGGLIGPT